MAKIVNTTVVVTVSKLTKEGSPTPESLVNAQQLAEIEAVVAELLGGGVVVEVEVA